MSKWYRGNVKNVIGGEPEPQKTIADLQVGESGYAVPWAYENGNLNTSFSIGEKGGTASLWVECVSAGQYTIEFEEPEYRNPFMTD